MKRNAYEIQSPFVDVLGEFLFTFDNFVTEKGYEPSFEEVRRVEYRATVVRHKDYCLCVYPNDHPPPHFHVRSNGENVAFSIETGERIQGSRGLKGRDKIIKKYWCADRHELAKEWNARRPTDDRNNLFSIPAEWGPKPTEEQLKRMVLDLRFPDRRRSPVKGGCT